MIDKILMVWIGIIIPKKVLKIISKNRKIAKTKGIKFVLIHEKRNINNPEQVSNDIRMAFLLENEKTLYLDTDCELIDIPDLAFNTFQVGSYINGNNRRDFFVAYSGTNNQDLIRRMIARRKTTWYYEILNTEKYVNVFPDQSFFVNYQYHMRVKNGKLTNCD